MSSEAPYKIRIWYPFTADYADADYSIEIKAPEIGNKENKSRNQTMARTRAGTTIVYDRGRNFNEVKSLEFRAIKDIEKAALQVFLESVQWGTAKLKYRDWNNDEYVIRVNTTELEYIDTGYSGRNNVMQQIVLWDFDLDILDLTNNIDELEGTDATVSSALALHLLDMDHPHNPLVTQSLAIADGTKLMESFEVDDWNAIHWIITVINSNKKATCCVHATNNGIAAGADATTTDVVLEVWNDPPLGLLADVTFTVTLSGAGATQIMKLNAASSTNGNTVHLRRVKL